MENVSKVVVDENTIIGEGNPFIYTEPRSGGHGLSDGCRPERGAA